MRKICFILLALTLMLSFCINTSAQSDISALVDYTDHSVNIEGSVGAAYKYKYVSLQVVNPNKNFEDFLTQEDVINWSDQKRISADGSFEFSYKITGDTGLYTVIVGVDGMEETFTTTFNYYSPSEVGKALEDIKEYVKKNDGAGIASVISTKKELLQIDTTEFYALPPENQELVCVGITESEVASINDFMDLFKEGVEVQKINLLTDTDTYYEEVKKLAGDDYKVISEMLDAFDTDEIEATNKLSVLSSMMDTDYKTKKSLLKGYADKVIIPRVEASTVWGELEEILYKAEDVLKLDFTDYEKINDKSSVIRKLLDKTYENGEKIKEAFNKAVKEVKNAESESSSSGSSKGGSSSSSKGSFVMPSIPVITTPDAQTGVFADLGEAKWAEESILALYEKNIVRGDGNNFYPNNKVTRAEFLKMVVLFFELEKEDATLNFNDVKENDWYYDYVLTAYSNGVVNGINDEEFNPNGFISRQDMAVIFYRAAICAGKTFENGEMAFLDEENISSYAKQAVAALSKKGIINGYDNKFHPTDSTTRAQAAQILYNML